MRRISPAVAFLALACLPDPDTQALDDTGPGSDDGGSGSGDEGGEGSGTGDEGGDEGGEDSGGSGDDMLVLDGAIVHQPDTTPLATQAMVGLVLVVGQEGTLETALPYRITDTMSISTVERTDWTMVLPLEVEDEWLHDVDVGVRGAEFILGAWSDDNGNGSPDSSDVLVAASPETFWYLEGEVTSEWQAVGLQAGWNRVERDLLLNEFPTTATALGAGEVETPLGTNLFPHHPPTLSGSAPNTSGLAVGAIDYVGYCDGAREAGTLVATRATSGEFDFIWPEDAPSDDLDSTDLLDDCGDSGLPPLGVSGAIFELLAYGDLDGDYVYDASVEPELGSSTANSGTTGSVVVYLSPESLLAVSYGSRGGVMGWNRIGIGGLGVADFLEWDGADVR